jgi:hypothetical protein
MKRLKIIIPQEKRYILSLLYDKFPHFSVDLLDREKPITFVATLNPEQDYFADLAWLKRIGLEYFDEKMERKKIISDFFKDVIIERMAVANVQFPDGDNDPSGYFRVVVTLHDSVRVTLHFPNEWEPPKVVGK